MIKLGKKYGDWEIDEMFYNAVTLKKYMPEKEITIYLDETFRTHSYSLKIKDFKHIKRAYKDFKKKRR